MSNKDIDNIKKNAVQIDEKGVKINHQLISPRKIITATNSEHTHSPEETEAFANFIISRLSNDPLLQRHFPFNPVSDELFSRLGDGLILTKLINLGYPGTVDESKINRKENMNVYQQQENLAAVLNGAKSIGCQIVNIGGSDIIAGR